MYRGSSPIFDVPLMRRIKPLPHRNLNSPSAIHSPSAIIPPGLAGTIPANKDSSPQQALPHTDTLTSTLALHSYYLPTHLQPFSMRTTDDDEDRGDGDYSDHLQQPGNTKKRKVPANIRPNAAQDSSDVLEDEPTDRAIPTGRVDHEPPEPFQSPPLLSTIGPKKSKRTAATIAGLQHKEMLKVRKRQLASVLGALSYGDTLALDQALSATFSATYSTGFDNRPKVRLSRRRSPRMTRATRLAMKHPHPDQHPLINHFDFTYSCPSPTADRLVAMKAEVASLRSRFEEELARQAAKSARLAASSKGRFSSPSAGKNKRGDRMAKRRTPAMTPPHPSPDTLDIKPKNGKKKKRSALANASNPHHLRNYVPSRLPYSTGPPAGTNPASLNQQNFLSPLPIPFLSAEIPPRRKKKKPSPLIPLTNPADEWICAFCEYELFYGDEQDYRRAIRNRKKILRRRRRARERASAAASGNASSKNKENDGYEDDDDDGSSDDSSEASVGVESKHKSKDDDNPGEDRGAVG